jgi:hypothetical protein
MVVLAETHVRRNIKEKAGGYNDYPPNWREITLEDFAKSKFFMYYPVYNEVRQMLAPGQPMVRAQLFWYHDESGIALVNDFWAGTVKYFAFATCEHELVVIGRPYNCFTEYTCTKCDWKTAVDSSD